MANCVLSLEWSNYKMEKWNLISLEELAVIRKKKKSKFINGYPKWRVWVTSLETIYTKVHIYIWVVNLIQLGLGDMTRCFLPLLKHGTMICLQTNFYSALITIGYKTLWKQNTRLSPWGRDSTVCVLGDYLSSFLPLFLFLSSIYHFWVLSISHSHND